jgi:hypothetical protein
MTTKQILTPEEISAIVDGLNPIDWEEMEMMAKCHQVSVGLLAIVNLK